MDAYLSKKELFASEHDTPRTQARLPSNIGLITLGHRFICPRAQTQSIGYQTPHFSRKPSISCMI